MDIFVLGLWSGLGLAVPLGPMAILLITTTMSKGRRIGLFGATAMATVDLCYALLVFALGSTLLQAIEPVVGPLRIVGSAVLLFVAYSIYSKAKRGSASSRSLAESATKSPLYTFITFFGLTVINPATAFYFFAITPSVAVLNSSTGVVAGVFLFAAGVFLASLAWQWTLVFSADLLSRRMTQAIQRRFQYFGAGLIALLALWLVVR